MRTIPLIMAAALVAPIAWRCEALADGHACCGASQVFLDFLARIDNGKGPAPGPLTEPPNPRAKASMVPVCAAVMLTAPWAETVEFSMAARTSFSSSARIGSDRLTYRKSTSWTPSVVTSPLTRPSFTAIPVLPRKRYGRQNALA